MLDVSQRFGPFGSDHRAISATVQAVARGACSSLATVGIVCMIGSMTGCYTYLPRPISEAAPKAQVSAEITDVGRVALGARVGSEVARIDGEIVQRTDSALQLTVSEVRYLNGASNQWQGQEITLRPQDVKSLTQRTYSKQRSMLAVIAIGGLAALAILTAAFTGVFGGDSGSDKPGDGGSTDR